MRVEKKVWPEYFDKILSGEKKFELRLGDFDIANGDTLLLKEWDPTAKSYSGRETEKRVTYVKKFRIDELFWSTEDISQHGLQVISIE